MRSMCGADAGCLAINYQSLSRALGMSMGTYSGSGRLWTPEQVIWVPVLSLPWV